MIAKIPLSSVLEDVFIVPGIRSSSHWGWSVCLHWRQNTYNQLLLRMWPSNLCAFSPPPSGLSINSLIYPEWLERKTASFLLETFLDQPTNKKQVKRWNYWWKWVWERYYHLIYPDRFYFSLGNPRSGSDYWDESWNRKEQFRLELWSLTAPVGILRQLVTRCLLLDKIFNPSVLSLLSEKQQINLPHTPAFKIMHSEQIVEALRRAITQVSKCTSVERLIPALCFPGEPNLLFLTLSSK